MSDVLLQRLVRAVDAESGSRAAKAAAYREYGAGRVAKHVLVKVGAEHRHAAAQLDEAMRLARAEVAR